jgi:hypothetical protein
MRRVILKEQEKQRFYLEINNSKLEDEEKAKTQLDKTIQYLTTKYQIPKGSVQLYLGSIGDQWLRDKSTLQITFPY